MTCLETIARAGATTALCAILTTACTGKNAPEQDQAEAQPRSVPIVTAPANGFGESIRWEPFDEGLARAKTQGLPVMLVVHASWCPRCKELKSAFFDDALASLSQHFVMVNVDADEEPRSQQPPYVPDGDYIPRVMFVDPETGKVDQTLLNDRRTRTRYFYTPTDDLVTVMKKALRRHERT